MADSTDSKTNTTSSTNTNERLLRHIESKRDRNRNNNGDDDDRDSVDTSDLLEMLEKEIKSGGSGKEGGGGGSDHDLVQSSLQASGSDKRQVQRTDSSFTSTLLGGKTDEPNHHEAAAQDASEKVGMGMGADTPTSSNYAASNNSSSDKNSGGGQTSIQASPSKKSSANNNYHSDTSNSKHAAAALHARPSFDNPFRSSNSLKNMAAAGATKGNKPNNNSKSHNNNSNSNNQGSKRIGGGSFSDYAGDVSGSDTGAGGFKDASASEVARSQRNRRLSSSNSNANSNGSQGTRQVSFSIGEEHEHEHATAAGETPVSVAPTKSTQSSDTFSLGSLAGISQSTRSSHTSRSSKSSRSSRSSHGSATTTSTHSSNSGQERRRRRELLPVKQERRKNKMSSNSATGSSAGNSSFSGSSFSSGNRFPTATAAHHHRRSRKKQSQQSQTSDVSSGGSSTNSRNLYNNKHGKNKSSTGSGSAGSGNEEGQPHKNLHDRHPVRLPKRSGLYGHIEEGNEGDDEEEGKDPEEESSNVPVRDILEHGDNAPSDEDGLFRRVNKVRNEIDGNAKNNFLDGLIASTTRQRTKTKNHRNHNNHKDNDDSASVGEASFLSELLSKNHSSNARKRKGGGGSAGHHNVSGVSGSIVSGHSKDMSNTSTLTNTTESSGGGAIFNIYNRMSGSKSTGSSMRGDHSIDGSDTVMIAFRKSVVFRNISKYYEEGGEVLPRSKKEWTVLVMLAVLLSPLVHVGITYLTGNTTIYGGNNKGSGSGSASASFGGGVKAGIRSIANGADAALSTTDYMSNAWSGSSQVMLSKSSSLRENFILIPDADWIELQMSRIEEASNNNAGGGSSLLGKMSSNRMPKPPQRVPLPGAIDPGMENATASVVLYSLTGANGKTLSNGNSELLTDVSVMNTNANSNLWDAIQRRLIPQPTDVWPCWNHNSLAQFREDGFTVMYPYSMRTEARAALVKLAKEFGQGVLYEFVTWSLEPTATHSDSGSGSSSGLSGESGFGIRGTSVKDNNAVLIPPLPEGRSDVMIRRTISTASSLRSLPVKKEPAIVMRRVKDLPVEDELTMREWEGPPLEEIVWKK